MKIGEQPTFKRIAPLLQVDLPHHLSIDDDTTDAIIGNLGWESAGFSIWHEVGQPPEKGGVGWAQWTGPRRKQFENYCYTREPQLTPRSYAGQLAFLVYELQGGYEKALLATEKAPDLARKTIEFEKEFESAGVPALSGRQEYAIAARALRKPQSLWARFWNYILEPFV
jgi:hypothetical protein